MKKAALIRFRCTPTFKAALEREAAYQQLELSELVRRALEHYVREGDALPPSLKGHVNEPPPALSGPTTADESCPHGRPSARLCWECA